MGIATKLSRLPSTIIAICYGSTSAAIHRSERRSTLHRTDRSGNSSQLNHRAHLEIPFPIPLR